ncbi:MAG: RidA family protein [Myxococcota bacterium]|nr:RidA family protein [Myxococcota bacterium]
MIEAGRHGGLREPLLVLLACLHNGRRFWAAAGRFSPSRSSPVAWRRHAATARRRHGEARQGARQHRQGAAERFLQLDRCLLHYNHISAQRAAGNNAAAQAEGCLRQLAAILEAIEHSLDDVVKVNIAVKNLADMAAVDEVYTTFFPRGNPARRVIGVSALPDGALLQLDAVVANAEGTPQVK